jgi:hypothetical protein
LCFPSCHVQHTASRCNYDCAGLPYRNCSCTMEFYKAVPCKPKMAIFFQVYLSFACRCSWLATASVRILSHIQVRRLFQIATNCCWLIFCNLILCFLSINRTVDKFSHLFSEHTLSMLCILPCTRYMLKIVDNEEFYEQEKPLSLKDLKSLILILKQVHTKQYHQCVIISHPLC